GVKRLGKYRVKITSVGRPDDDGPAAKETDPVTEAEEKELAMTMACFWWTKAAENGLPEAQFLLGCAYADGNGVSAEMDEAVRWWRLAAAQGWLMARALLEDYGYAF
ncbi:MAG: hypothetical protein LBO05_10800, partial [Deltaproteobacteria bacterium]|nr:hypothetical protein [Deltaproteobacteria bacterium]